MVEEEYDEYVAELNPSLYSQVIKGKKGLVQQRQFIEQYYEEGTHLIMGDDDIVEVL